MKNKLSYWNFLFVFQAKCKISTHFTFKDILLSFLGPDIIYSGIIYRCKCGVCNATYYGKIYVLL